jgi:hypothetical protein
VCASPSTIPHLYKSCQNKVEGFCQTLEHKSITTLRKCSYNFIPKTNATFDESMIKFKGRMSFRQYLPAKPTKMGVKLWNMADSDTIHHYSTIILFLEHPLFQYIFGNNAYIQCHRTMKLWMKRGQIN